MEKTKLWAKSERSHKCLYRQCIRRLYVHGPPSFSIPFLWGKSPGSRRETKQNKTKHTLKGNRAKLSLTLRPIAPATWDLIPPLDRAVLAREPNIKHQF